MLFIDMKLEQTHEMFCNETLLVSVSAWLKRRYEMIFSQFWKFKLGAEDPNYPQTISDRILIENGESLHLLEQYHGIRPTFREMHQPEEIIGIAYQELKKGLPVAVYFNDAYFPWVPENAKQGVFFPCFIVGISDDDKGIYCIDIHEVKKPAMIPINDFLKGYKSCMTFSIVGDEKENIDWRHIIQHNTDYLLENNAFASMRELSKLLANPLNYITEITNGSNVINNSLSEKIKLIYHSRYHFSHSLTYLIDYHKAHVLADYRDRFIHLSNQWLSLWGLVTMNLHRQKLNFPTDSVFQKNFNSQIERASVKLCNIADTEEGLCSDLIKTMESKPVASKTINSSLNAVTPTDIIRDFKFVDILNFLNNEGFSSDINTINTASLTGTEQVFLTHGFPSETIWDTHGMKFHFPHPIDGKNDNISCTGQTINFENDYYSCIMFLGCAEWGHYSELLDIHYKEGTVSQIPLEFTDWTYPQSHFGEFVVWEGMCGERDKDGKLRDSILKGHLFARALRLDSSLQLDYIHLPDCSNIHLFAITLGK